MQSCNALQVQYFFLLLLLCTATISSAYISPFYFRTKPYMGAMATNSAYVQRSPQVNKIQSQSPKVESSETGEITVAAPGETADHLVRIMDPYIRHMPSHANVMSQANEQLLIQSQQQILKKQHDQAERGRALQRMQMEPTTTRPPRRRAYDHNCFFTPVNCHPWI
ncbi:hypothetical protein DdX_19352 [Ditylenchus destructor]|uniref:Uncharacterized protein n=1 Tax=Ditylenchus destructor TaxID=166010 RepID=A0AAD4QSD3_9BILA|nr:hypothetical protein DdX_19352 [Ditylenchus destructor]